MPRLPSLPFDWNAAAAKVRAIEDSWNSCEPMRVARDCTIDSVWRTGIECLSGRAAIEVCLARKWVSTLDYRRINELWAVAENRIAARFVYECRDASGNWYRAYGNENWELCPSGLIRQRFTSINKHPIPQSDRAFLWPLGRRPDDYPELSDFDF